MPTIHVVSHTHWDREWYHPAGRFRQRLVALIDELLDDPPAEGRSFLLDGQAVVLDDYLSVRPERAAEITALLRRGALEAGPWFVLADELIPGAEALVRNLLAGRRALRALRAEAPPVLYCPDAFGHPAALPALARGFGLDVVIAWRGFGGRRWPAGDACWWRAPSGERVLLYHLPPAGYVIGADLPTDPALAALRWTDIGAQLMPRSRLPVALLPNGGDHLARQRGLGEAVAALARSAAPIEVCAGTLRGFAAAACRGAAQADLPEVQGELRDSYGYAWTLQGTFGTRAHQKRAAARLERLLVREVEPWSALAERRTGRSRRTLVQAAWRELLLDHPHDTLCGCAIDEVAHAFATRLDEGVAQAAGLRDDAVADLAGHDPERAANAPDAWRAQLLLRNPAPRPRGGVAIVRLSQFVADVPVGPGSGTGRSSQSQRPAPRVAGVDALQTLDRALVHERLESPRADPNDDLVEQTVAAVWVPEVPAYGLRALPMAAGTPPGRAIPNPVRLNSYTLANGRLTVAVSADGVVGLRDEASGRTIADLLAIEDQIDAGDLYTPSLRGDARNARLTGVRVLHRGPLRGTVETSWRVAVRRGDVATLRVALSLDADSDLVRVAVAGENAAEDHRLRLCIRTDIAEPVEWADAAFGPIQRRPLTLSPEETAVEAAPPTAPLHRYVTLTDERSGATLFSDGLAEYEADAEGRLHVTLVRAVGELSRNDLPERPGHAGWPIHTPGAQCRGRFFANFAFMLHGARSDAVVDLVERTADDVLLPVTGATMRSLIDVPPEVPGLELQGQGLAFSSAKESEDGEWLVLRCVNLFDHPVRGRWVVPEGLAAARFSRLDETPGEEMLVGENAVEFEAGPRAVVTILVR